MNKKIEAFLWSRGFVLHEVRVLLRNQAYLSVLGVVICLILFSKSIFLGFVTGAVLGGINFYFLAKVVQELVCLKSGAVVPLLFNFYFRLAVTGVILFISVVYWEVSIYSLLIGLSIVLLNILIFGATLVGQKFKEA